MNWDRPWDFSASWSSAMSPYNACRDIALMRLPALYAPEPASFPPPQHGHGGQGRPWDRPCIGCTTTGPARAWEEIPFFLKGNGKETQPLGESAGNGVLVSETGDPGIRPGHRQKCGRQRHDAGPDRPPALIRPGGPDHCLQRAAISTSPARRSISAASSRNMLPGNDLLPKATSAITGDHGTRLAKAENRHAAARSLGRLPL